MVAAMRREICGSVRTWSADGTTGIPETCGIMVNGESRSVWLENVTHATGVLQGKGAWMVSRYRLTFVSGRCRER